MNFLAVELTRYPINGSEAELRGINPELFVTSQRSVLLRGLDTNFSDTLRNSLELT